MEADYGDVIPKRDFVAAKNQADKLEAESTSLKLEHAALENLLA